ncbi:MAG: YraN family protein [Ruminococcaceae bacterium]|nr:YraN family protein [Oscillospiraceae bacterium]
MSTTFINDEAKNLFLGRFGEDVAANFLEKEGYKIVGRNLKFGKHELDIVAEDKYFLVFVEVKTRSCSHPESGAYGNPGRAVTYKKRSDTIRAVYDYIHKNGTDKQPRIDVIEVFLQHIGDNRATPPQILNINHIRNAFDARGKKH